MADGALAGLRVLVVEDETMVSLLIEDTLLEEKCTIVGPFSTFDDALKSARSDTFDLAVLDVNIAGTKVYPVAEILDKRSIPFVLLSGYGSHAIPSDRPHWRLCNKPFRSEELIEMLIERYGDRLSQR